MNGNKLQSVPVPPEVPIPGKVPVPRNVLVSETDQSSQENSSDSKKFAIGIGIICILLILLLLLLLLRNATMSQQADTSAQQTAGKTETTDDADTAPSDQGRETNQNGTENNNNQQSTETATSTEEQTQNQAQNRAETNDSGTKIQEDGHKESATEKHSEDKPQIESSEKITQSEETTDVPTQNQTIAPSLQSKYSKNYADGYSDGFHQGDATVKIFGTEGKGSKFVFVFDRSYSMAGTPLEATKRELIQSLTSLRDHHKFNIIFYDNQQLIWKQGDKLVPALKQNKKDAEQFIANIGPGGGTEPLPPLLIAIDYKPDVIVFLTDGELELDLDNICNKNKKIRINVIQFGSTGNPSALLQKLAQRTRGDYKYIDVRKLDAL
ncbi:MAG: hypothetical protein LBG58_07985 [Planctomycetaceae bacterium]|jgi:hypothetical protein|nr:hypothetical protein [Planctomycetaceae bacterium]